MKYARKTAGLTSGKFLQILHVAIAILIFLTLVAPGFTQEPPSTVVGQDSANDQANIPDTTDGEAVNVPNTNVIVTGARPNVERIVAALEKERIDKQRDEYRDGKPSDYRAVISVRSDVPLPAERIRTLIDTLSALSIQRISFTEGPADRRNSIVVNCPADVTWQRVRNLQEALGKEQDFAFDVRVAADKVPISPTGTNSQFTQEAATPVDQSNDRDQRAEVTVFQLKYIQAAEATRVVRQMFGNKVTPAVEERTNSIFVVSSDPVVLANVKKLLKSIDSNVAHSLSIDVGGTNELRRKLDKLERRTLALVSLLHDHLPNRPSDDQLKNELRDTVRQAFDVRQKLQLAELAEFTQNLHDIRQSIEMRSRISEQIIDRRVEELLDPKLLDALGGPNCKNLGDGVGVPLDHSSIIGDDAAAKSGSEGIEPVQRWLEICEASELTAEEAAAFEETKGSREILYLHSSDGQTVPLRRKPETLLDETDLVSAVAKADPDIEGAYSVNLELKAEAAQRFAVETKRLSQQVPTVRLAILSSWKHSYCTATTIRDSRGQTADHWRIHQTASRTLSHRLEAHNQQTVHAGKRRTPGTHETPG